MQRENETIFRVDLDALLASGQPIVLELGCGPHSVEGRIGIDHLDLANVDIVADLNRGFPYLPDNCVDEIHSKSLLEHIDDLQFLMGEIWRVLKPTGKKKLFVPHFSNPYYYSDYTHTRFFGLYTFEYFSKSQTRFKRKVPSFYVAYSFRTEALTLSFHGYYGRFKRYLGRILYRWVNRSPGAQEFYEANLCYIFPCYGMHITLSPEK